MVQGMQGVCNGCRAYGALYLDGKGPEPVPGATATSATAEKGKDAPKGEAWDKFEQSYKELSKWVELTDVDYVGLHATYEVECGRPANAIKVYSALLENKRGHMAIMGHADSRTELPPIICLTCA